MQEVQGKKVSEICRDLCLSVPTFRNWKSRFGGMSMISANIALHRYSKYEISYSKTYTIYDVLETGKSDAFTVYS